MKRVSAFAALVLSLLTAAAPVWAHKGSDAYLEVRETAPASAQAYRELQWVLAIAIKDLDQLVPIDANADGKVTWGEIKAAMPLVQTLLNSTATTGPQENAAQAMAAAASVAGTASVASSATAATADSAVTAATVTAATATATSTAGATPAAANACRLDWQPGGLDRRSDGAYLRLVATARCPVGQPVVFNYRLFREQDATHRLLVAGNVGGKDLLTIMSPQQSSSLALAAGMQATSVAGANGAASKAVATGASKPKASARSADTSLGFNVLDQYFALGIRHLLEGYDHLAFLLALVLPLRLVLFRRATAPADAKQAKPSLPDGMWAVAAKPALVPSAGRPAQRAAVVPAPTLPDGRWVGAPSPAPAGRAWWTLLRTVTAFTVGHSITLALATFGLTQASPTWVEPVIALSVGVTALLNLRPVPWIRTDVLALLFGMVHGFGFAGLLQEAAAPGGLLPWALAGFNLGVEAGQLLAVSAWVLLSQTIANRAWYPAVVVRGGSILLMVLAAFWMGQRIG